MHLNPSYAHCPATVAEAETPLGAMRHRGAGIVQGDRIEEDPTGLLLEGFRYRDLDTGTFITRDPIGPVIMMPREKWLVDGKEVTPQQYEEALEPGMPQVGTGPVKTAKNTGEEADIHTAVATGEAEIPGRISHCHTAAAGFPNLYTYTNQNPWTFFDPEGLDAGTGADASKKEYEIIATREKIAKTAESHVGSQDWLQSKAKDNFKPGSNKCNKGVYDWIDEATGGNGPIIPGKHFWSSAKAPTANDWANPDVQIPGWSKPVPAYDSRGAVIAQQHGDYGHTGIVVGPGQTVSVNSTTNPAGIVTNTPWGFRPRGQNGEGPKDPAPTVRIYGGQ